MDGLPRRERLCSYSVFSWEARERERVASLTLYSPQMAALSPVQVLRFLGWGGCNGTLRISETLRDLQVFPVWLFSTAGVSWWGGQRRSEEVSLPQGKLGQAGGCGPADKGLLILALPGCRWGVDDLLNFYLHLLVWKIGITRSTHSGFPTWMTT